MDWVVLGLLIILFRSWFFSLFRRTLFQLFNFIVLYLELCFWFAFGCFDFLLSLFFFVFQDLCRLIKLGGSFSLVWLPELGHIFEFFSLGWFFYYFYCFCCFIGFFSFCDFFGLVLNDIKHLLSIGFVFGITYVIGLVN